MPAADAAYCLGEAEKWDSGIQGLGTQARTGHSQASRSPRHDPKAPAKSGVGTMNSTVMMTGSEPNLNWGPDPQGPAPKSCWDAPLPKPSQPYPGCGQDPQGEETGSKQVPESMPVKL